MIKTINELVVSVLASVQDAMPMIVIIMFYQMTVLQIPVQDILAMLGWVLFITAGMILAL